MSNSSSVLAEADYVIVGGGTAGLVLAARISEDPNTTVVILEAGKDMTQDPRVNIPALWTSLMGSDVDWQYQTSPQVRSFLFLCPQLQSRKDAHFHSISNADHLM
jgi:choline dehydrogenase-like flavoprotein